MENDPFWQIRRLMREVLVSINEELTTFAASFGLTQAQAIALCELDPAITMRDLSDLLCTRPTNITTLIDKLENLGLVERRGDPGDRRITRLYLTEAGKTMRETLLTNLPSPSILTALTNEQRDELLTLLRVAVSVQD